MNGLINSATKVVITHAYEPESQVPLFPELIDWLLDQHSHNLCEIFDQFEQNWKEFKSGLSLTEDQIERISIDFVPMGITTITLHKREA